MPIINSVHLGKRGGLDRYEFTTSKGDVRPEKWKHGAGVDPVAWMAATRVPQLDAESEDVFLRIEGEEGETRAFMRNALSTRNGGTHKRTLVGELNGVRLYITDEGMLMTKRDVY